MATESEARGARQRAVAYHQRSKHHFERYALGPDRMDWATQPDPFRRFAGAPELLLPLAASRMHARYRDLFDAGSVRPEAITLESVAILLELSFGLSAWKASGGERWALRCNPSSGNLHPTECSLAISGVSGIADGIYHYACRDHLLEQRCAVRLPFSGLLVGLSSIFWREAWKYGERAFRYCQHDIGHALAALGYAAAVLGWRVRLLEEWGDDDIAAVFGFDRDRDFGAAEREVPELCCLVGAESETAMVAMAAEPVVRAARSGPWQGRATVLSPVHRDDWPAIDAVHGATIKPRTMAQPLHAAQPPAALPPPGDHLAAALIRQRRSAQAFDGTTSTGIATLWRLLDATLPRTDQPPFAAWPAPPLIHLLLFVHRVEGLPPGIYWFPRREGAAEPFRPLMRQDFTWRVIEGPGHLRLHRLLEGDCRQLAATVSCHQEIAGDSVLSLGMLAEFDRAMHTGAWMYRRLFWESGLIGQALYLEAEAAGLRGTGIGCFFDDAVHQVCGLSGTALQSLYHFTLGGPLTDRRIRTLPPYGHLDRS